jgi:hypothetical protein
VHVIDKAHVIWANVGPTLDLFMYFAPSPSSPSITPSHRAPSFYPGVVFCPSFNFCDMNNVTFTVHMNTTCPRGVSSNVVVVVVVVMTPDGLASTPSLQHV